MKRLVLIRHAKSDWIHQDLADHDRPLNPRGRAAAVIVGQTLAERGYLPDEVLCSTAMRTRETWAGIADQLPDAPEPTLVQTLYHASPDVMLDRLQLATGSTVALIGHNPGIAALADSLPSQIPDHERFPFYPTGATLVVELENWVDLVPGQARLVDFFVPRDFAAHP